MVERSQDGYAWIQFRLEHKNQQIEMLMMRWMGRMRSGEAGVDWLSVGAVCFGSRICGLVMLCGLWLIVLLVLLILPYTDKWKISLEVISFSENCYTFR